MKLGIGNVRFYSASLFPSKSNRHPSSHFVYAIILFGRCSEGRLMNSEPLPHKLELRCDTRKTNEGTLQIRVTTFCDSYIVVDSLTMQC